MTTGINLPTSLVLPELIGILILLAAGTSAIMPGMDRWNRRFFLAFYIILMLNGAILSIDIITYRNPAMLAFSKCLPFFEFLFFSVTAPLMTAYLLYSCREDWRKSTDFFIVISLWGFFCILLVIAQSTTIFYYTAPDGQFYLTRWLPVMYAPMLAIMIFNLTVLIRKRKKLSKRYFYGFLICMVSMLTATSIHVYSFNIMIINTASIIGSITMYVLIRADQVELYMRQQADLANQKASIMVLQMRPHFIYNTMTSIYYLCDQDPKKAQKVILDFTSYLRKNFDAISNKDTISFSEELEHVRAYLAVEIVQFEDYLSVEYDIPHTQFRLPALTLEPLVENSIKYGMDPDSEPLHILIQTRETDSASVIVVEDNGPGFDAAGVFSSNNALSNIRQRLKMMCNGSITITTAPGGGGTTVKIVIPNV